MDRFEVILADTRHAGNIGAVARVMKNLGFSRLTLVNPTSRRHLEAVRMAVGAGELIERARVCGTLAEAIEPLSCTFATARRIRRLRKAVFTPFEAAARFGEIEGDIGLVFGSEKLGLSNEQITALNAVISIPASPEHPSYNLAQAAAIVLYETARGLYDVERPKGRHARRAADPAEMKALRERMRDALYCAGFLKNQNSEKTLASLEDIFARASLDEKEVRTLLGVFKQIKRSITGRG